MKFEVEAWAKKSPRLVTEPEKIYDKHKTETTSDLYIHVKRGPPFQRPRKTADISSRVTLAREQVSAPKVLTLEHVMNSTKMHCRVDDLVLDSDTACF